MNPTKLPTDREDSFNRILNILKSEFPNYKINVDLEDCDKVLRVECSKGLIDNKLIIELINDIGFYIAALPDTISVKTPLIKI